MTRMFGSLGVSTVASGCQDKVHQSGSHRISIWVKGGESLEDAEECKGLQGLGFFTEAFEVSALGVKRPVRWVCCPKTVQFWRNY